MLRYFWVSLRGCTLTTLLCPASWDHPGHTKCCEIQPKARRIYQRNWDLTSCIMIWRHQQNWWLNMTTSSWLVVEPVTHGRSHRPGLAPLLWPLQPLRPRGAGENIFQGGKWSEEIIWIIWNNSGPIMSNPFYVTLEVDSSKQIKPKPSQLNQNISNKSNKTHKNKSKQSKTNQIKSNQSK